MLCQLVTGICLTYLGNIFTRDFGDNTTGGKFIAEMRNGFINHSLPEQTLVWCKCD